MSDKHHKVVPRGARVARRVDHDMAWSRRYDLAERIGLALGDVLWPLLFAWLLWRSGR